MDKESKISLLTKWQNKLDTLLSGEERVELRFKFDGLTFDKLDYAKNLYIVGYCEISDVSFRISCIDEKFEFNIEHKGHTLLNKYVDSKKSEQSFETYFFILRETIEFEKTQQERIRKFPNFTKVDNRNNSIESILS